MPTFEDLSDFGECIGDFAAAQNRSRRYRCLAGFDVLQDFSLGYGAPDKVLIMDEMQ